MLAERRAAHAPPLDVAGALLATTGLASLVLAFTLIERDGPLATSRRSGRSPRRRHCWSRSRGSRRARRTRCSTGAVLKRPGVLGPNAVAAVLTATTSPAIFMCTLHAQQVLDIAPATAGLLFAPVNLAVIAGSLLGPRVVSHAGPRPAMAGGLFAVAAGALALCAIAPDAPALTTLPAGFVVLGLGLGVASVASTTRGTDALESADQGLASALLTTSAQLGTAFGLAVFLPIAAARTEALGGSPAAHVAGYELGFELVAVLAIVTAVSVITVRSRSRITAR